MTIVTLPVEMSLQQRTIQEETLLKSQRPKKPKAQGIYQVASYIDSYVIFAIALGLQEPWNIKEVSFDVKSSRLNIHLEFTKGHKFKAPDGNRYTTHDTVARSWQHLNFFQHHCHLHAKMPRVKQKDGTIKTQSVPWARAGSGFTLLFEALSMLLIENEMPINKVAKVLKVYPGRIYYI